MLLQDLIAKDFTIVGTGRWLRTREHDSLVINTEEQYFFWNSRGIKYGKIKDWYEKVKKRKFEGHVDIVPEEKPIEPPVKVVQLPELVDAFYRKGIPHREYWYDKRGYTNETIDRFRLGYSGEYHTIPIYEDGKFVNFQCRKDNPKRVKHWYRGVGPHSFNFSTLKHNSWAVITEGPVDAIMLRQNKIPAVSQTSGAGDVRLFVANFHKFHSLTNIYIVYDNDKAGRIGSEKLAKVFGNRARVYTMQDFDEGYDITDFFKDGHSREEFIDLLENRSEEIANV